MGTLGFEVEKGLYLGIDFGTTNTVVSVYDYDAEELVTLALDGQMVMPTVVQFEMDAENDGTLNTVFGLEAKEGAIIYPNSTVMSVKRLIGKDQPIMIEVEGRAYDLKPEDIVGQILGHIRQEASKWLQEEKFIIGDFSGCVITVPANSTDKQKHRMKEAAVKAGFIESSVFLRLEPAAAAMTYAKTAVKDSNVLVYDFGGGTFDACLLKFSMVEGEEPSISILSTYGDHYLGGNDVDKIMMDIIYSQFLDLTEGQIDLFDLEKDDGMSKKQKKMAIVRLYQAANQAKERLSTTETTKIVLAPFIQEPKIVNLKLEVSRETFSHHQRQHPLDDDEEVFELMKGASLVSLVDRTLQCVRKCVEAAGLRTDEVDEVFLVGGSSAIPEVGHQMTELFDQPPYQSGISPALSISQGAAYYCHRIMLPTMMGPKVLDTTIHPLGLELSGRRFLEIIEAGTHIPEEGLVVEAEEALYTNFDGLTSLAIVIYEDTEPQVGPKHLKFVHAPGMKRLAATTLSDIPEGPRGYEKVQVIFRLDRDNLLTVEAKALSVEGVATQLAVEALY